MANPTMTLIASYTVGSGGVSSVGFSSIPATYTDLLLKASIASSVYGEWTDNGFTLNGSNGPDITLYGTGSGAGTTADSGTDIRVQGSKATSGTFASYDIYIPNYTSSNPKSISWDGVTENNSTTALTNIGASTITTGAVTSLSWSAGSGNFIQYTTLYLYGINNS